jgi:hypothetical protein
METREKHARGSGMKDYQAQLEKLRTYAAECALTRDLATDPAKRELFDRLAIHLGVLADQVEMAMLERKTETGGEGTER